MKNKFILCLLVSIAVFPFSVAAQITAQAVGAQTSAVSSDDQNALTELVNKYYQAMAGENADEALRFWHADAPERQKFRETLLDVFAKNRDIKINRITVKRFEPGAAQSRQIRARAFVDWTAIHEKTNQPSDVFGKEINALTFAKENDSWRIFAAISAGRELANRILQLDDSAARLTLMRSEPELWTVELGNPLLEAGQKFVRQGKHREAIELYELVRELAEKTGERAGVAAVYGNMGTAYYSQGEFDRARGLYQKSLDLASEIGNKYIAANQLGNLGAIAFVSGDYDRALEMQQQSLAVKQTIQEFDNSVATSHQVIAAIYMAQGDLLKSIASTNLGLALPKISEANQATLLNNLGAAHFALGNHSTALEYYQKSLATREKLQEKSNIATSLLNIADVYLAQTDRPNNVAAALENATRALALTESVGAKPAQVISLTKLGAIALRQQDYQRAADFLGKAFALAEAIGDKRSQANILVHLSQAQTNLNQIDKALDSAQRAARIAGDLKAVEQLWTAQQAIARVYRKTGDAPAAEANYRKSIETLETLRERANAGGAQQNQFFNNRTGAFNELVELLVEKGKYAAALDFAERAKARTLLDILQNGRAQINKQMTAAELAREKKLNLRASELNARIARHKAVEKPDAARLAELETELKQARFELEAFETEIYASHAALRSQRGELKFFDANKIGEILPRADSAAIHFVANEKNLLAFVLTKNQTSPKVFRLNLTRAETSLKTEELRRAIAERATFEPLARELYDRLLAPLEKELVGINELVIVPDGALWNLPFQALKTTQDKFLLELRAVSSTLR